MYRYCLIVMLSIFCCSLAAFSATVVLNGSTVTVPVVESNGKAYVDVVALIKLLGGTASFDAATHKVVIKTAGQASAGSQGTSELPGEKGKFGTVYTLRKNDPLYFSLKSAEYSVSQVVIGDELYAPKVDEKLIVLHFTIQNPQKDKEVFVRWDTLKFQAFDSKNVTHDEIGNWGDTASKQRVEISLKPAQTIEAYTAIPVPADGEMPKLMIQPNENTNDPVIRYDLLGIVAPLKAPFADPADKTGATALKKVPAQLNIAYPYNKYNITVEKYEYTTAALEDDAPEEGGRFFIATLKVKNVSPNHETLRWDSFTPVLTDNDGVELEYKTMLAATQNRQFEQPINGGQEFRVRVYFAVPKGMSPKTLTITEDPSRSYVYAIQ